MKCLESFLKEDLKYEFSSTESRQIYSCREFNGLARLLSKCFVFPNEAQLPLPIISELDGHKAAVDQCIFFLLSERLYTNVLTYGYRIGASQNISSALHCVDVNSNVVLIKSEPWQLLHRLIGTQHFVNLIINHALFLHCDGKLSQVLGHRINSSYFPEKSSAKKLENPQNDIDAPAKVRSYLYKSSFNFKYETILPPREECFSLRQELTAGFSASITKAVTNQMDSALSRMLSNHSNRIKYLQIFNNLCPKPDPDNQFGLQTPTEQVLKFLIVVVEKLIPKEMFGSKKNKAVIFRFTSKMLKLPIRGSLQCQEIVACLKVKSFHLFRPPSNYFSKLDFERANYLMRSFISWLFKDLIPTIISTFFYCTEISSCTSTLFFRHDVWNAISLPFFNRYLDKFLIENTSCRNHESFTLSKFNHHKVRIIPKKNKGEFRIIAIPLKGADDQEFKAFQQNLRNVVCPVQCVLEYLRSRRKTHFEKLYSANQIGSRLGDFKSRLLQKYGELPKFHFLKFDIDSCYDFIPREKVMSVVRKAIAGDFGFFIRSQSFYDPKSGCLTVRNVVNGSRKCQNNKVFIDNVRTFFISAEDLIHTIETDLFQSALCFKGKCYVRKTGLFQGTSFSALLVDLVYDELLEHYEIFHSCEKDETLVLRLADDFLILSTDETRIAKARDQALDGFAEFNAKVNRNKVLSSEDLNAGQKISFCALDIDSTVLEVSKSATSLVISEIQMASTSKLFGRLLALFEARLSYGTTDLLINSSATVLNQIEVIASNVAESFTIAFNRKKINAAGFSSFFGQLSSSALRSCCVLASDDTFAVQIRLMIASSFLTVLSKKRVKYGEIIRFLQSHSIELLRSIIYYY